MDEFKEPKKSRPRPPMPAFDYLRRGGCCSDAGGPDFPLWQQLRCGSQDCGGNIMRRTMQREGWGCLGGDLAPQRAPSQERYDYLLRPVRQLRRRRRGR